LTFSFAIQPEKTTLSCRLFLDSNGTKIISLDSMNKVFYSGNVSDVKFEFVIEDETLKTKPATYTRFESDIPKHFRIEEIPDQKAISFFWNPPINERIN